MLHIVHDALHEQLHAARASERTTASNDRSSEPASVSSNSAEPASESARARAALHHTGLGIHGQMVVAVAEEAEQARLDGALEAELPVVVHQRLPLLLAQLQTHSNVIWYRHALVEVIDTMERGVSLHKFQSPGFSVSPDIRRVIQKSVAPTVK